MQVLVGKAFKLAFTVHKTMGRQRGMNGPPVGVRLPRHAHTTPFCLSARKKKTKIAAKDRPAVAPGAKAVWSTTVPKLPQGSVGPDDRLRGAPSHRCRPRGRSLGPAPRPGPSTPRCGGYLARQAGHTAGEAQVGPGTGCTSYTSCTCTCTCTRGSAARQRGTRGRGVVSGGWVASSWPGWMHGVRHVDSRQSVR